MVPAVSLGTGLGGDPSECWGHPAAPAIAAQVPGAGRRNESLTSC